MEFGCARAMTKLELANANARVYGGAVVMIEIGDDPN